jgi:hypothetical protein
MSHLASMRRRKEKFGCTSFVRFKVGVFNGEEGVFVGGRWEIVHWVGKLGFHTAAIKINTIRTEHYSNHDHC